MAKLCTSISSPRIPIELSYFATIVGQDELQRRLRKIRKFALANPPLGRNAVDKLDIPLGIGSLYGRRVSQPNAANGASRNHYLSLAFIAQANEIHRHISTPGRRKLRGQLIKALSLDGDARQLAHEFRAATYLSKEGWDVSFSDLDGTERYDLTAWKGPQRIELECKTIAGDTGAAIRRGEATNLVKAIFAKIPDLQILLQIEIGFELSPSNLQHRN